jgi:hypothetical protein
MADELSVVLDVTLERGVELRRWSIRATPLGWECMYIATTAPARSHTCLTREAAEVQRARWQEEIDMARAKGWA